MFEIVEVAEPHQFCVKRDGLPLASFATREEAEQYATPKCTCHIGIGDCKDVHGLLDRNELRKGRRVRI